MSAHSCPLCKHKNLRHLHTQHDLNASKEKAESVKARKKEAIDNQNLPEAEKIKRKKKVKIGKVMVQECYCICYLLSNSCECSVGPFTYKEMPQISGWKQDYDNSVSVEDFGPNTTSQNAGALVASVLEGTLAVGSTDIACYDCVF